MLLRALDGDYTMYGTSDACVGYAYIASLRSDACSPNRMERTHSAQQESLAGSLYLEIATIFSASAIVG